MCLFQVVWWLLLQDTALVARATVQCGLAVRCSLREHLHAEDKGAEATCLARVSTAAALQGMRSPGVGMKGDGQRHGQHSGSPGRGLHPRGVVKPGDGLKNRDEKEKAGHQRGERSPVGGMASPGAPQARVASDDGICTIVMVYRGRVGKVIVTLVGKSGGGHLYAGRVW